jgi:transcriptional repressor NrdR
MVCIYCSGALEVTNSRAQARQNQVWRRRHCKQCGAVFTTNEAVDYAKSLAVQGRDGSLSPFKRDKLLLSIFKSCQHRKSALEDAAALTDTVLARTLQENRTGRLGSMDIAQAVLASLRRFDTAAAVHYEAYHPTSAV